MCAAARGKPRPAWPGLGRSVGCRRGRWARGESESSRKWRKRPASTAAGEWLAIAGGGESPAAIRNDPCPIRRIGAGVDSLRLGTAEQRVARAQAYCTDGLRRRTSQSAAAAASTSFCDNRNPVASRRHFAAATGRGGPIAGRRSGRAARRSHGTASPPVKRRPVTRAGPSPTRRRRARRGLPRRRRESSTVGWGGAAAAYGPTPSRTARVSRAPLSATPSRCAAVRADGGVSRGRC
jgi:hypothetical protein